MYYLIGWVNCGHGISANYENEGAAFAKWFMKKHKIPALPYSNTATYFCAGSSTHELSYKMVNIGVIPNINPSVMDDIILKGMYDPHTLFKRIKNYLTAEQKSDFISLFIEHKLKFRVAVQIRHYAYLEK